MTQFSLFGAEAAPPALDDLDGLVLAGGQWVRSARGVRLSVVVADRWRADALLAALADRGLAGGHVAIRDSGAADCVDTQDATGPVAAGVAVRTRFTPQLSGPADRWTRGASLVVPGSFDLTPGGLRLWALAAGRRDAGGYLLTTARAAPALHAAAGSQLARLGVAATGGTRPRPGWRVTSARRLRRLAELLGPPPAGGHHDWPDPRAVPATG